MRYRRDSLFWRFRLYGFLKNLRFFDPFLVLFFREAGFSFLDIGILYAIREICTNIFEIPTGVLADAFGRRKAMLASFCAYLASFAVFYAVPEFWAYALAMVLFALGETFRSGTHKAMILEHLRLNGMEDQKVSYYGHTRAASQLGSSVAALIAAGLVFYVGGYRIVFLASCVPYILGLALFLTYPKQLDGERRILTGSLADRMLLHLRLTLGEFLSAARAPAVLRGLFSSAGFDALFKSSKDYLQPILQAQALALPVLLGLTVDQRTALIVGILYFGIYLFTSFACSRAGSVERWLRSTSRAGNLAFLAGLALLATAGLAFWGGVPGVAIAAFLLLYAVQNLRRPILVGFLAEQFPHRTMATGLSVESQVRTLLMAAISPLLGFVADRLGVGMALLLLACVGIGAFPFMRLRKSGIEST